MMCTEPVPHSFSFPKLHHCKLPAKSLDPFDLRERHSVSACLCLSCNLGNGKKNYAKKLSLDMDPLLLWLHLTQFPTPIHQWHLPGLPDGTEVYVKVHILSPGLEKMPEKKSVLLPARFVDY